MKESASEANLTVVAIILVAVIVAIGTPLIASLMKTKVWQSCCTDQGGVVKNQKCEIYVDDEVVETKEKSEMLTPSGSCVDVHAEKKEE